MPRESATNTQSSRHRSTHSLNICYTAKSNFRRTGYNRAELLVVVSAQKPSHPRRFIRSYAGTRDVVAHERAEVVDDLHFRLSSLAPAERAVRRAGPLRHRVGIAVSDLRYCDNVATSVYRYRWRFSDERRVQNAWSDCNLQQCCSSRPHISKSRAGLPKRQVLCHNSPPSTYPRVHPSPAVMH